MPNDADLRRAADILNGGKKVAMLVGAGALGATDEVMEVAELLGAGVAKALLGKAVLPDDLPFCTGPIGLLGTKPSWDMMTRCDTLLMIGSSFPYSEFLPKEGQARGVQIDIDAEHAQHPLPDGSEPDGDSAETLRALDPAARTKEDRAWREADRKGHQGLVESARSAGHERANPINPQRVFWELSPRLPDNCILVVRFRFSRELVRARSENSPRNDGIALRQSRDDGPGRALCGGREIRLPRSRRSSRSSATARCR